MNTTTPHLPVIAITPGEPAGIGPDLAIMLPRDVSHALVVIADTGVLADRARVLRQPFATRPWPGRTEATGGGIYHLHVPAESTAVAGRLDTANASYVIRSLERAVEGCLGNEFDALVTGPVQKSILNDAGISFTGHTEFLAEHSRAAQPVMMLATRDLRVALATTHMPLAEVSRHITVPLLTRVIEVIHADLRSRFGIAAPRLLVCGLNPHAGEGGHLGREEITVIEPVVRKLKARGWQLTGPVPADTAFTPARLTQCDAVLAMYHDQGLPVIKHHDFANAVNITLGLPFVRTSVDHGTALDLAGTGRADPSSLLAALTMALELATR